MSRTLCVFNISIFFLFIDFEPIRSTVSKFRFIIDRSRFLIEILSLNRETLRGNFVILIPRNADRDEISFG